MGWDGPILTDSGGFQVMSLAGLVRVDDDGRRATARTSTAARGRLRARGRRRGRRRRSASTSPCRSTSACRPARRPARVARAVARTTAWAARGLAARRRADMALFGIVQGGLDAGAARDERGGLVRARLRRLRGRRAVGRRAAGGDGARRGGDRRAAARRAAALSDGRGNARAICFASRPWDMTCSIASCRPATRATGCCSPAKAS